MSNLTTIQVAHTGKSLLGSTLIFGQAVGGNATGQRHLPRFSGMRKKAPWDGP